MFARLLAAPWLGVGRSVETFLSTTAFIAAMLFLWFPNSYGASIAIPLLIKAILTGGGLVLHIVGHAITSRYLRFFGGLVGAVIWTRIFIEILDAPVFVGRCESAHDSILLLAAAYCVVATLFSAREMGLALADLPAAGEENGMARE